MNFYRPNYETHSDYNTIRRNGMWYQSWQAGYFDIIKKGYPKPKSNNTILAELYSPDTEDFLHGGDGNVPFLISERTKHILETNNLTGFEYLTVEISKIASKNKKGKKSERGEPEDQILRKTKV